MFTNPFCVQATPEGLPCGKPAVRWLLVIGRRLYDPCCEACGVAAQEYHSSEGRISWLAPIAQPSAAERRS